MAVARVATILAGLVLGGLLAAGPCLAESGTAPEKTPTSKSDVAPPEVWIFTGVLPVTKENVSGTIVGTDNATDFEMKLSSGTSCDSSKTEDGVGIIRLPSFPCSDKRDLQAVFVPQGGENLKVVGYIGGEEFSFEAHRLADPRDGDAEPGARPDPILPPAPSAN